MENPIVYYLLQSASEHEYKERSLINMVKVNFEELGWDDHFGSRIQAVSEASKALNDPLSDIGRTVGYVGWLVFNPQFRRELLDLKSIWMALGTRPVFPLQPDLVNLPLADVSGSPDEPDRVASFIGNVSRFARKWELTKLVTWDLPDPQGTLEQIPLELLARLSGKEKTIFVIPNYLNIPSNVDFKKRTTDAQRNAARDSGIEQRYPVYGTSSRGVSKSQYENALRFWLIERSVLARYGKPAGYVARLTSALRHYLGCSEDRVKQLRKIYRPHLGDA